MPVVNWGMANQGGFQNALAMYMHMGAQARQARDQRKERNALAAYAKDPNEQNFSALADVRPDFAIQERGRMEARQQETQLAEITQRAVGGDEAALGQLATLNFDRWRTIGADQKKAAAEEATTFGNAAMDVLNRPPEQWSQAILGYAQQLNSPEIAQIAQLPPQQQAQALRAAVAEAGMIQRLIEMERPSYMAIPAGGTLVNTRDSGAVSEFGQQGGVPGVTGETMTFEQFQGMVQQLSPAAAARQVQRLSQAGVRFSVSTPEQARQFPSGTQIILPDGSLGVVP